MLHVFQVCKDGVVDVGGEVVEGPWLGGPVWMYFSCVVVLDSVDFAGVVLGEATLVYSFRAFAIILFILDVLSREYLDIFMTATLSAF